jgi:hypothetical protein
MDVVTPRPAGSAVPALKIRLAPTLRTAAARLDEARDALADALRLADVEKK